MRKRVISTLLAMATTAGLFAGNVSAVYAEGKSSGDYEYQELEDAEITYYNYSVEGKELYEKEIAAYNEVHPNVKINLELVGGGTDWRSTLKAEISSGQAPDLVVMEGASDFDTFGDMIEDLSDQHGWSIYMKTMSVTVSWGCNSWCTIRCSVLWSAV